MRRRWARGRRCPACDMMGFIDDARALIDACFREALSAVEPAAAVRRYLRRDGDALVVSEPTVRCPVAGRVAIIAVGKAAPAMARGAEMVCGDLVADGIVI